MIIIQILQFKIPWLPDHSLRLIIPKLNQNKCHTLVSGCKHKNVWVQIGDEIIWKSKKQNIKGFQIDRNLILMNVPSLCKKAGKKLSVLERLLNFMNIKQGRVLMKSLLNHSRVFNHRQILRGDLLTSRFGLNSRRYFTSNVRITVPSDIKNAEDLYINKSKIRPWEPKACRCHLCLPYVINLGFVNLV